MNHDHCYCHSCTQSRRSQIEKQAEMITGGVIQRFGTERDAARAEVARLREALEYYANASNYGHEGFSPSCPDWSPGEIEEDDRGEKARAALAGLFSAENKDVK
jgi:hypothetical protein